MAPITEESDTQPIHTIIVLVGGITATPHVGLQYETKKRLTAATHLYAIQEQNPTLILSGGKTAGEEYPSEAQVMQEFLQHRYTKQEGLFLEITQDRIVLDERSIDTSSNLLNTIYQITDPEQVAIITSSSHIRRVKRLAKILLAFHPTF